MSTVCHALAGLSTNMINNDDNDDVFQDSNFIKTSDLSYIFDFNEKEGSVDMNLLYEENATGSFGQNINAVTEFCEPATNSDMFDSWKGRSEVSAVQKSFNLCSTSTSSSRTLTPCLSSCFKSQFSNQLFQQASSTACKEGLNSEEISHHSEHLQNTLLDVRPSPVKKRLPKHSSQNSSQPGQGQQRVTLPKMLSAINTARSPSQSAHPLYADPQRKTQLDYISEYALKCLTDYGFCAVDNFMGHQEGSLALDEVMNIESQGLFEDGRLASQGQDSQSVRGDKIFWIDSDTYPAISKLIATMDKIIFKIQQSFPGKSVQSRTKPMVACYPGLGAAYRRHVDNSNSDGRLITCLYYLNKDWDILRDGGMLRLYPSSLINKVEIEPIFDRILFFWSDSRNPHEVLPAFRNRYAITVWYFDQKERDNAMKRLAQARERK